MEKEGGDVGIDHVVGRQGGWQQMRGRTKGDVDELMAERGVGESDDGVGDRKVGTSVTTTTTVYTHLYTEEYI